MKTASLSSGILHVLFANVCNLVFSLLTSLLLPKYLSVETYASIKTFQLYVGYAGLLHLGFVDGMYIKNGGKELKEISGEELSTSLSSLRIMQTAITVVVFALAVVNRDHVFLLFALSILPINMAAYFQMLFQAIGEFKRYGTLIRFTTGITFLANMCLLFVVKSDSSFLFLYVYMLIYYLIWIALESQIRRIYHTKFSLTAFDIHEIGSNVRNGFLLTLGNLSSALFTGMDRWFVKLLLTTIDFAQYSFAVSIEHFMNVALNPVSITLYNHFCKKDDTEDEKRIRNYVLIFASITIMAAFPAKFVLESYLQKYIAANNIIFLLFSAQLFYFTIKSIYINLYKARRQQRRYFTKLILAIVLGFALNIACYSVYPHRESFAFGTLISSFSWWLLCVLDFRDIPYRIGELLFMFTTLIVFNTCGFFLDSVGGFLVYGLSLVVTSFLFMKNDVIFLLRMISKKVMATLSRKRQSR